MNSTVEMKGASRRKWSNRLAVIPLELRHDPGCTSLHGVLRDTISSPGPIGNHMGCLREGFLNELKKETLAQKFTFAELEENEEDLHKLTLWIRKIHRRDFFGGPQRDAASVALTQCQSTFELYTAQVYRLHRYEPPEEPLIDEETPQED
jgi:hypothetical protein